MAKRVTGAGVNRSAARKASEIAALRRARLAAHEAAVTEAVGLFFDRSGRAAGVRAEAKAKAERIMADAEESASVLDRQADAAVATLKGLGEPVVEIATMTDLPVVGVRAALARADTARCDTAAKVGSPTVSGGEPPGGGEGVMVAGVGRDGVVPAGGP